MEKEARAKIREKILDKQNKIYSEMEERNKVVDDKRSRVLAKLTVKESKMLKELIQKNQS